MQLVNGVAAMPDFEDPAIYVDVDGLAYRCKPDADGQPTFQRALLADLELIPVKRRESLGAWGYYGDEPLLFLADPLRQFYRVKDHPMVRKP